MHARICVISAVALAACASSSNNASQGVSPTFDFATVESVYVETPIEVRLRTAGGGDTRAVETAVAGALREFLRRDLGWRSVDAPGTANATARFELTDWESGSEGTRVGGRILVRNPVTGETVFSASHVHPSRFGAGAAGTPVENLPDFFRSLFKALIEVE